MRVVGAGKSFRSLRNTLLRDEWIIGAAARVLAKTRRTQRTATSRRSVASVEQNAILPAKGGQRQCLAPPRPQYRAPAESNAPNPDLIQGRFRRREEPALRPDLLHFYSAGRLSQLIPSVGAARLRGNRSHFGGDGGTGVFINTGLLQAERFSMKRFAQKSPQLHFRYCPARVCEPHSWKMRNNNHSRAAAAQGSNVQRGD